MSDPVRPQSPEESIPGEPSRDPDVTTDGGGRRLSDVVDSIIETARKNAAASAESRRARAILSRSLSLKLLLLGVVIIAVTTVGAYLVSSRGTEIYGAQVEFLVQSDRFASDSAINRQIQTQSVLILSRAVLEPVATRLGMETTDLEEIVTAEVIGESQVVRLLVANPDPDTARQLANAIAGEYLARANNLIRSVESEQSWEQINLVTEPYVLDAPLEPQPLQGAAAGALGGLVIAAGVAFAIAQRAR
jgi:capsular polysaccharide biosynthesis protein